MNKGFNKGFILGIVVAILAVALVGGGFLLGRGSADKDSNKDNKSAQKVSETAAKNANEDVKDDEADDATVVDTETENKDDSEEFKPDAVEMDTMEGVEFTSVQEWEEEDWHCYNYTVKIHNNTKRKVEEWVFKLEVPEDSELSQYWESKMKLEDNEIVVEPVDYNKEIEKGGEVSFGFILKTKVKYNYKKANKDLVF